MYDDPRLELVGSPPPSSSRAPSSAGNMFVYTDRSYQYGQDKSSRYENEIFGVESGRDSASQRKPYPTNQDGTPQPNMAANSTYKTHASAANNHKISSGKKKKRTAHTPSYTDKDLFGKSSPKPEDAIWNSNMNSQRSVAQTPTTSNRSYTPQNYYTKKLASSSQDRPTSGRKTPASHHQRSTTPAQDSYRSQMATPTQNISSPNGPGVRPGSAKKKNRNRHNPSYVDELLFGPKLDEPSFASPWDDGKTVKPHRFDMTDYKSKGDDTQCTSRDSARPSSRQQYSSRPGSRQSVSSGRINGQGDAYNNKKLFKQSYVDENLFGPKPVECDWDAPWENPRDKHKQPLIFDSSDYKMKVEHSDIPKPRPQIKSSLHKTKFLSNSTLAAKPVWK